MEYIKKPLSFEEQADRLLGRGLVADRDELIRRLSAVSYYRLSEYWFPYREEDSDSFRKRILIMMCWDFLRKISPTSRWRERVEALFAEYPEIPVKEMGLPEDWKNHPLWKS